MATTQRKTSPTRKHKRSGLNPTAATTGSTAIRRAPLISREDADQILGERYPTDDELDRFPLGHALKAIPDVNEPYGSKVDADGNVVAPGHIRQVVKGMNILLGEDPEHIVQQWTVHPDAIAQHLFTQTRISIFQDHDDSHPFCRIKPEDLKPFFRLCVLYHDIGKYIIHERHPLVGWHLIKDVYQHEVERELYPLLLGIPYAEWDGMYVSDLTEYERRLINIFESVIKFHDLFGVLSTGEGSLPVMVDLIKLTGTKPEDAKELFSVLMLFNLADLYGSVPEVFPYKVNAFCDDWKILCNAIEAANGNRNEFFRILREASQTPDQTVKRITRFMNEGAPPEWRGDAIEDKIIEIFTGAVLAGIHSFCVNYAMFCKLDYGLAFKIKLMNTAHQMDMDVTKAMGKIMWLLGQLDKQFGDLCKRRDGSWRRLGLELAGLTRKPSSGKDRNISKIGDTISRLLLETEEKGKEWAAGECTVWFMEE